MMTNVGEQCRNPSNSSVDQDIVISDDISMLDNQVFSFPRVGVRTTSSGFQNSNNVINGCQGINKVSHFENIRGSLITNSINANRTGAGNSHMSALDAETQNHHRQPAEISRTFTDISSEPKLKQTILPRVYNNQVRLRSFQPNSEDKLDGGFLSLGYQGEVASYTNCHGGKPIHHTTATSFSSQCQTIDSSFNNVRGGFAVFENNIGGPITPLGCVSNQTLSGDNCYGLQAMKSGFDTSSITNLDGQVNIRHYIPTPSRQSGIKNESIIDLSDPSACSGANSYMLSNIFDCDEGSSRSKKRRMQRVPLNSSVLESNHQISSEPQQKSHLSSNLLLPSSGTSIGEYDSQDKSGLACGFVTSSGVQTVEGDHFHRSSRLLPAGHIYPPFPVRDWPYTGQGADITINNELPCSSSAVKRDSFKRIINLPSRDTTQTHCRKILPQASVQQFSPCLLQNALSQIAIGPSAPVISSSMKAFDIPSAVKDLAAGGWPRNTTSWPPSEGTIGTSNTPRDPQHPTASSEVFVPPIHIPPTCTISQNSLVSLDNTSTIPVVSIDSPVSVPLNAPLTALARTMASHSGSSRIPIPATSKKKVMAANISPSVYWPSSAITPQRSQLLHKVHTSSTMNHQGCTDWKKSMPALAALAKTDPALRASQVLGSMSRIKWQGFDTTPTIGFKCMICNRDLSFTPDGPVVQPPIPPAVAVLPCGHTFHDECLLLITPEDQSKDPPCIPCAIEN